MVEKVLCLLCRSTKGGLLDAEPGLGAGDGRAKPEGRKRRAPSRAGIYGLQID